jgi:hypothetical protein
MKVRDMNAHRANRLAWNRYLILIVLLWLFILAACGGDTRQGSTGSVVFKVVFMTPGSDSDHSRAAGDIDICTTYGIEAIRAMVIDSGGTTQGEGNWPCDIENHHGVIDQIETGSGYRVVVEGLIGGTAEWRGEISDITVTVDQTTNVGVVEMIRVGQYAIVASAGSGGSIEPSGTIGLDPGGSQTFTITPDTNFQILDVVVDGASAGVVATYTFADVAGAHTIQATFAPPTFTVIASAGTGGSIDPSGTQTVNLGDSPAFTLTADPGFYLSSVLINGSAVAPQNPYIIANISADTTIQAVFSPVVFVNAGASAGGDGSSWVQAFNNLQAAINASSDSGDIWMKGGTYTLSNQVSVNKAVTIYGGFRGDEELLDAHDPAANTTIIDGDHNTRCLFISADAIIDGLSIQNGRHIASINGQGGGIYIDNAAPHLINCAISNNALDIPGVSGQGGAIYNEGGSPVIANCHFENNLTSNTAQPSEGGAIFNNGGFPSISNTIFINNRAPGDGSGGGAIYISSGNATITACRFVDNYAGLSSSGLGGAIYLGGGIQTISDSYFQGNLAEGLSMARGGAIYNASATLTLTNTIFLGNEAWHNSSGFGGAIYNNGSDPFITNCTFFANRAVGTGSASAVGGAIYNHDSRLTIVNSIIWGNVADQGVAIHDDAISLTSIEYSNTDMFGVAGTDGNIDADPLLDAQGHLRPGSPCVDRGDDASAPETDIDGETRPQGFGGDMGADEFVDGDADGMPDYWENTNGLDADADDGAADLDGDGVTNAFEYRFDLDPDRPNPVLDAAQQGHYDQDGNHDQDDDSTPTGLLGSSRHRSYFTFALNSVSDTVVAAVLRLEVANYTSTLTSDDLDLYDVSTNATTLEQTGSGETGIFNDLGGGTRYVRTQVGPGDVGQILEISLPSSALSDINASPGSSFSIGLHLNVFGVATEYISFSTGTEAHVHQLVLRTE